MDKNKTTKLKALFFGTSDRSIPILESLKDNFNLALCITKKDTKIGRKQEKKECGVKKWAKENNIEYLEIESLRDTDLSNVIEKISDGNFDFGIVCDFSFIIPYKLISILDNKLINIHFSILPKYRGASPVQYSILNGDNTTGITFHLVNTGVDNGDILYQYEYNIEPNITSGELYDLLFKTADDLLPDVVNRYVNGDIKPILQDNNYASYTYSPTRPKSTFIYKEDAQIDWTKTPQEIERQIRAFNPWPISWTLLKYLENNPTLKENNLSIKIKIRDKSKDLKVKIFSASIINNMTENDINILDIKEIQLEGKKKTSWKDFKNSYFE